MVDGPDRRNPARSREQRGAAAYQATMELQVCRYIGERRHLEDQLAHIRSMESLGTLAGGVAHDINNVLSVILGLASGMHQEEGMAPDMRRDLLEIESAAKRGRALVQNLLGFARRGNYRREKLDPRELLERVYTSMRRSIDQRIELRGSMCDEGCMLEGDPSQLETALMNLCDNAREAIDDTGWISMDCSRVHLEELQVPELPAGWYMRGELRDSGKGMAPGVLRRCVEPFFTTKHVGEGAGLGLSMAYGVFKNHGGGL